MTDYASCPICGDGDWPAGTECRRVKAARNDGTLPPVCLTCGGKGYVGDGGYIACTHCDAAKRIQVGRKPFDPDDYPLY